MNELPALTTRQKKVLCLSALGGVLEYYDFVIYLFLAPFIEKIFFSSSSPYVATLKTLAIFAAGYFVRPLGGLVFSHFGDKYGRKVVFLLTVVFMAIPSFAMGFLPSSAQAGAIAPTLILLFRLMQGLALGGEIPASITFVSEHVPRERQGFALATLFFGINLGLLLGSLMTTLLTHYFSEEVILAYAWRIPFIIGGFFGLVAIYLRRYLHETAAFAGLRQQELVSVPVFYLARFYWRQVVQGSCLVALGAVTIFFYLYWPQYLHQNLHYNLAEMMQINTMGTVVLNLVIIFGGLISDRLGYRRVYMACALALGVVTYPLFVMLTMQSVTWVIVSYIVFSSIIGFIPSSYAAIISSLYPTQVRYSGIALSYNAAFATFGGLSPVICTILIHSFHSILAPAYYIIFVTMLAFTACYLGRNVKAYNPAVTLQELSLKHG